MILLLRSPSRALRDCGEGGTEAQGQREGPRGQESVDGDGVQAHVLGARPQMKGPLSHCERLMRPPGEGRRVSRGLP